MKTTLKKKCVIDGGLDGVAVRNEVMMGNCVKSTQL